VATIADVPSDQRELARLIPVETLPSLSADELSLRLDYASELMARAKFAREGEAKLLRREAEGVLGAMSLSSLARESERLRSAYDEAVKSNAYASASALASEMDALDRLNPRPPLEWAAIRHLSGRSTQQQQPAALSPRRRFWRKN
jgi:hypothetical protein